MDTNTNDFSFEHLLLDAESYAPGLSDIEVYAMLDIDETTYQADQIKALERAITRGRAKANKRAVDHLFSNMSNKGGEKACVDYLRRFADEWPQNEEYASTNGGTFTVNLG